VINNNKIYAVHNLASDEYVPSHIELNIIVFDYEFNKFYFAKA